MQSFSPFFVYFNIMVVNAFEIQFIHDSFFFC